LIDPGKEKPEMMKIKALIIGRLLMRLLISSLAGR
jgi:hypothetical protein